MYIVSSNTNQNSFSDILDFKHGYLRNTEIIVWPVVD